MFPESTAKKSRLAHPAVPKFGNVQSVKEANFELKQLQTEERLLDMIIQTLKRYQVRHKQLTY